MQFHAINPEQQSGEGQNSEELQSNTAILLNEVLF